MLTRRRLLVVAFCLLCVSTASESKVSSATTPSETISISTTRLLRAHADFDLLDADDNNQEERVPSLSRLAEKVATAKDTVVSKLAGSSMPKKLRQWAKEGKSVGDVKTLLGLETVDDALLPLAKNFQYFDDYALGQVPVWSEKGLSPHQVREILGIASLSETRLLGSPYLKYYDKFVETQIPIWIKNEVSPSDVMVKLGLVRLKITAINHRSPSYIQYSKYMGDQMEDWAMRMYSKDVVAVKFGVEKLEGTALSIANNWVNIYAANVAQYRVNGWYKQKFTSYDVWKSLHLDLMLPRQLKESEQFKIYQSYTEKLDKKIDESILYGFPFTIPIVKDSSEIAERIKIWVELKRSDSFVLHALGLNSVKEESKRATHENYKIFLQFTKARDAAKALQ